MSNLSFNISVYFLISFYFFPFFIYSQSFYELRGSVKNIEGEYLQGIEFFLENEPTIGTVSDSFGKFKLTIPSKSSNDTLIVNALGYKQKKISVKKIIHQRFLKNNFRSKRNISRRNQINFKKKQCYRIFNKNLKATRDIYKP